jgi:hypothetical protein
MKRYPNYTKETVVVLHTSKPIDISEINKVILSNKNVKTLNNLIFLYKDKVKQVHFHGKIADLKYLRNDFLGVIKVFAQTKHEVIKQSKMLKEKKCFVCPEFPIEKLEDISFITSMGIAVDLLYTIDHMNKEVVLKIVDHYLYFPSLNIPIEPFHSILMSILKEKKLQIWNLHLMFPGLFFHVDNTGVKEDPNEAGRENSLKEYFESIPKDYPGCMSCAHFHVCFSWGKYKKDSCFLWKEILDRLQSSAKEIQIVRHGQVL